MLFGHILTREKSFHENTKTIILIQSNSSQEEGGSIVVLINPSYNNISAAEKKYIQQVIKIYSKSINEENGSYSL